MYAELWKLIDRFKKGEINQAELIELILKRLGYK